MQVAKDNFLIEASYFLSLIEQRFILCCLAKLDSRYDIGKSITITAKEYSQLMNIPVKRAYDELKESTDKLYDRSITLKAPTQIETFRWIQKQVKHLKGSGSITITWSDDVLPYISQLKNKFTKYKIKNIVHLKTSYAIRFYELLIKLKSNKEKKITLSDFRLMLSLGNKYLLFKELKRIIISPSVKQINETTDLFVSCSFLKKGRKIESLYFDICDKKLTDKYKIYDIKNEIKNNKISTLTLEKAKNLVIGDMIESCV